jgi:hypothetical protein
VGSVLCIRHRAGAADPSASAGRASSNVMPPARINQAGSSLGDAADLAITLAVTASPGTT